MEDLKVGDVVRLNSGGAPWVVIEIKEGMAVLLAELSDGDMVCSQDIPFACLRLAKPTPGSPD